MKVFILEVILKVIWWKHNSGFIISGSRDNDAGNTAELYQPGLGVPCSLPLLPDPRSDHTHSSNGLICGGYGGYRTKETATTCLQWRNYTWQTGVKLSVRREDHLSWLTPNNTLLLLGGHGFSARTAEVVNTNGTKEKPFILKYPIE